MAIRSADVQLAGWIVLWVTGFLSGAGLLAPARAVAADADRGDAPCARSVLASMPVFAADEGRRKMAALPVISDAGKSGAGADIASGGILDGVLIVGLEGERSSDSGLTPVRSAASEAMRLGISGWSPWFSGEAAEALGDIRLVFFDSDDEPAAAALQWVAMPGVEFAEPYAVPRLSRIPDDPRINEQGFLALVEAYGAWDFVDDGQRSEMVAIVDGGVWIEHPDLAANVFLNEADPPNGVDDDGNGFVDDYRGWNFAVGNDDPGALIAVTPQSVAHGTHVAGLVGAVTNNGLGVAGVGWNAPLLCVAAGHGLVDGSVLYAYQGLLYAAERGARIINCSWDGAVTSLLQKKVIDYLLDLGVVIVAAAGNQGDTNARYPAAFAGVIGVANLTLDLQCAASSSRGLWVDLAAPGTALLSTHTDSLYARLTGTSMASPVVAGCAALLLGRHPELSAEALRLRLRVSAQSLRGVSPDAALLGAGLVSARAALAWDGPGFAIVDMDLLDADQDGIIEAGEQVVFRPRWRNLLDDAELSVTVDLSCDSPWVRVLAGRAELPALASGQAGRADGDFIVEVAGDTPPGAVLALAWDLDCGRQTIEVVVAPLIHDLLGGEIELTLGANGRLGFIASSGGTGYDGLGVNYRPVDAGAADNLLFEGALLVATGADRLSDAARSFRFGEFFQDFRPLNTANRLTSMPEVELASGARLTRVAASFSDSAAAVPLPVRVDWQALAPRPEQTPGCALVLTTVTNIGVEVQRNLHVGFFLDWDLYGEGIFPPAATNSLKYFRESGYSLAFRTECPEAANVATALVAKPDIPMRFRCINNNDFDPENPSWGLYLNFSDAHKWEALSDDDGPQEALNTDVSVMATVGPVDLAPDDSLQVVLVMAAGWGAGDTVAHVKGGIEVAHSVLAERDWNSWEAPEAILHVGPAWPNPWNGVVRVAVQGNPLAAWRVLVYDLRGRLVYRSAAVILPSGEGILAWDGRSLYGRSVPSGGYLMIIGQGERTLSRKVTLVR